MSLSGAEISIAYVITVIGLIGNIKLLLNKTEKKSQMKWSFSIYGAAIFIIIVGLFTPPDILSNIIISVPLTAIYIITLNRIGFKAHSLKKEGL